MKKKAKDKIRKKIKEYSLEVILKIKEKLPLAEAALKLCKT